MIYINTLFAVINRYNLNAISVILLLSIVSCSKDDTTDNNSTEPVITKIDPSTAYVGDILKITGKGFGDLFDSSSVWINNLEITSYNCMSWEKRSIKLELPFGVSTGKIRIETKNGISNEFDITIGTFPQFDMITVPVGEYIMGSGEGNDDEKPAHKVFISRSFGISKYEIIGSVWHAVVYPDSSSSIYRELPASNISWMAAIMFCNRLSVLSGFDSCYIIEGQNVIWNKSANGYRLPTEAEWEYACRAGTTGDFSGTGIIKEMGWYDSTSGSRCLPPGLLKPNDFGIYDMHGNLWEWCWDYYNDKYYSAETQTDPSGPQSGARRVIRGGSFVNRPTMLRSSNRTFNHKDNLFCGIRVVRNKFD
jgi:formylglycine-generating enzyme